MSGCSQGVNVPRPPRVCAYKMYLCFDKNTFKVKRKKKQENMKVGSFKQRNQGRGNRELLLEYIENGLHIFYMIFTSSENDKSYMTLC